MIVYRHMNCACLQHVCLTSEVRVIGSLLLVAFVEDNLVVSWWLLVNQCLLIVWSWLRRIRTRNWWIRLSNRRIRRLLSNERIWSAGRVWRSSWVSRPSRVCSRIVSIRHWHRWWNDGCVMIIRVNVGSRMRPNWVSGSRPNRLMCL